MASIIKLISIKFTFFSSNCNCSKKTNLWFQEKKNHRLFKKSKENKKKKILLYTDTALHLSKKHFVSYFSKQKKTLFSPFLVLWSQEIIKIETESFNVLSQTVMVCNKILVSHHILSVYIFVTVIAAAAAAAIFALLLLYDIALCGYLFSLHRLRWLCWFWYTNVIILHCRSSTSVYSNQFIHTHIQFYYILREIGAILHTHTPTYELFIQKSNALCLVIFNMHTFRVARCVCMCEDFCCYRRCHYNYISEIVLRKNKT